MTRYDRTATLSGVGTLSATARERHIQAAALSATGTLSATAYSRNVAVTLSGAGTLSGAAGVRKDSVAKTLSATGTLSAIANLRYTRAAALSVIGTLSATRSAGLGKRAILSATCTLSATVVKTKDSAPAALSGAGVLSATAKQRYTRTAALSATGTLSATRSSGLGKSAQLSMIGTLSAIVVGHIPNLVDTKPAWAQSVNAFAAASRQSVTVTTAMPLQFPSTNQLTGMCGNLLSGSAFTNGLLNYGDPNTQGVAGALVGGTQATADSLCGMLGGVGSGTTPQSVIDGAGDVQGAIDGSPMASGTIALGQNGAPTNNVALDAIHGVQNLANTLYGILSGCGCGAQNDPAGVSPQQVISTTQETADGVTNSPFASGIIAMGQDPAGSGNVALDAINGVQTFADALYSILAICGCGVENDPASVSPLQVVSTAQATADAVADNPVVQDFTTGDTGNLAVDAMLYGQSLVDTTHAAVANSIATGTTLHDVVTAGGQAIQQNTSNHVGHMSLTTAQSVSVKDQNLVLAQSFSTANTVVEDPDGNWVWDGTDGAETLGCLKATANGTLLDYVSNEIPVVFGETIELACNVKFSSLSYTGTNPIAFGVEKYRLGKTATGATTYLDVGGYDVTSSILTSPDASSGDWFDLAGTYVVERGVDQLRFRFKVASTCSAGTISFDEAYLLKIDLIADECVPGVGLTVDALVTQLKGTEGDGFTHNQAAVALGDTAAILTSVTARLAALTAQGHAGAIAGDDFSWISSELTDSPNWGGGYASYGWFGGFSDPNTVGNPADGDPNGHYITDGADAIWDAPIGAIQTSFFNWAGAGATSDTNYQLIQLVLDSDPGSYDPLSLGFAGYIRLYGRVASDWSSYIVAEIGSDATYTISYYKAGVLRTIDSGACAVPGRGALINFYCGDVSTSAPRLFTLQTNSTTITSVTEVGTNSLLGASNLGWGWGSRNTGGAGYGIPPSVNQFLAMDQ